MMTNTQSASKAPPRTARKSPLMVLVLPIIACMLSSVVGIIIGQLGNLLYTVLGEAANCLAIPGFFGLFLITFGLSFLCSKLLRKWLIRPGI
jgi:hypothetical protein